MRKKRVLVLWYSIDVNLGDYYIYKTACDHLTKWGYEVLSMNIGFTAAETAAVAKTCDFVWYAGGGIIERTLPDAVIHFAEYQAQSGGVPFGVTGLSIGDFDYSEYAEGLRGWVRNATFFTTRDAYTAAEMNRISGTEKAVSSVDVVFACDLPPVEISRQFVGVNYRELPYVDLSGEFQWENWDAAIAGCISKARIGIPDQHDCRPFTKIPYHEDYTPETAIRTIGRCDYVVGMRYHVMLLAARLGKVCIPLCYCPKVSRLADQLGLSQLKLGVHDFEKLPDMVALVEREQDRFEEMLREKVHACEMEAKGIYEMVEQHLFRIIK